MSVFLPDCFIETWCNHWAYQSVRPMRPSLTSGGDPVRTLIPHHFSTSLTIAEQDILGDLLAFLIQLSADFHDTRLND